MFSELTNKFNKWFQKTERKCLIGDFNSDQGSNKENEHLCTGPFDFGEENDNTDKLLSLCDANNLLIGGTWFRRRPFCA